MQSLLKTTCDQSRAQLTSCLSGSEEVQAKILTGILNENRNTEFGKTHDLISVTNYDDFINRTPVRTYADHQAQIKSMLNGEKNILTHEEPLFYERTSGTSFAEKHIPITPTLIGQFQNGFFPMLSALFEKLDFQKPQRFYWVISSPTHENAHQNDSAYFPANLQKELLSLLVQPTLHLGMSSNNYWRAVSTSLLKEKNLGMLFVWSPTYIEVLLQYMQENWPQLSETKGQFPKNLNEIWPELKVISCWADGPSSQSAKGIQNMCSTAQIFPKGLMSTEAIVSTPVRNGVDPVLSITSHFFEFIDLQDGTIHLAHDVVQGNRYVVCVTTGGGLYRYKTDDIVEITGWIEKTPTLKFIGRSGRTSDIAGEKLDELFVEKAIAKALSITGLDGTFATLIPNKKRRVYQLLIDGESCKARDDWQLREVLEKQLLQSVHYAHCRHLQQLAAVEVVAIGNAKAAWVDFMMQRGKRVGVLKPTALSEEGLLK